MGKHFPVLSKDANFINKDNYWMYIAVLVPSNRKNKSFCELAVKEANI